MRRRLNKVAETDRGTKTALTQAELDYYGYGGEGFTKDIDFYSDSAFVADKLRIIEDYQNDRISSEKMLERIAKLERQYTTDLVMSVTLPTVVVSDENTPEVKKAISEMKIKTGNEIDAMFNEVIWPKIAANMADMSFEDARNYLQVEQYGDLPVRDIIEYRPNLADSVATFMIDKIAPEGLLDSSGNYSNARILEIVETNNRDMRRYKRKVYDLLNEFDILPTIETGRIDPNTNTIITRSDYGFELFNEKMSFRDVENLFNVHNAENTAWIAKATKDRDAALAKWETAEDDFVGKWGPLGDFGAMGIGGEGEGAVWNPLVAVTMESLFGWTYDWWVPDHEEVWHNYRILWNEEEQKFGSRKLDNLLSDLAWHQENLEAGPPKDYKKFEEAKEYMDDIAKRISYNTKIIDQSGYDELLEFVAPEHIEETFK